MIENKFEMPYYLVEESNADLELDMAMEEDRKCNADLEAGLAKLFTCIKDWDNFCKSGNRYYVRIDNLASDLSEQWQGTIIENVVRDIPVVYWIYIDNGLGTLKRRIIFDGNFSEYFV